MATIAVIGAGVFGAWSALKLAETGHEVVLVDAYGPANGRASSADHSRVIRAGYGADAIYSEWAARSIADWRALAAETGETLLTRTGALFLGPPGFAYLRDTFATLSAVGRRVEWIEPGELAGRYPQMALAGLGPAVYEPDAGVIRARRAVRALAELAVAGRGVRLRIARVEPLDEAVLAPAVRLTDGTLVEADVFVFACGPWLPTLFPRAIGGRIRATRQEVLYYGVPPGDTRFRAPQLPVWIDFSAGLYGIPDLDGAGFKIGIDQHGPPIDPDTADRLVDPALVESTRAWLSTRFPGLRAAPLLDARVCQYENTATGDFIIDEHPSWPNVWIVGGGSGHGFKHGPAVARHLVGRLAGNEPASPRFALAAKTAHAERLVY